MVKNCGPTWVVGCGTSTSAPKTKLALTSVSFLLRTGNYSEIRFEKHQHHGFMHLFLRNSYFQSICGDHPFILSSHLLLLLSFLLAALLASASCVLFVFLLCHATLQHSRNTLFLIFQACRLIPCLILAALTVTESKLALWQNRRSINESSSTMHRKSTVSWPAWQHTSTITTS